MVRHGVQAKTDKIRTNELFLDLALTSVARSVATDTVNEIIMFRENPVAYEKFDESTPALQRMLWRDLQTKLDDDGNLYLSRTMVDHLCNRVLISLRERFSEQRECCPLPESINPKHAFAIAGDRMRLARDALVAALDQIPNVSHPFQRRP